MNNDTELRRLRLQQSIDNSMPKSYPVRQFDVRSHYVTLGTRFKQLRKSRDWNGDVLAEKLDISRSYLGDIESDRTQPTLRILIAMARLFEMTVSQMLQPVRFDERETR